MIRKICPICDQAMRAPHYCRNCRSWVKEPYVRDVNYFLNERHPQQETDCSYHREEMIRPGASSRSAVKRGTAASGSPVPRRQPKKSRGFHPALLIVVIAMTIILSVMVFVLINVTSRMDDVYDSLTGGGGYDIDLGGYVEEAVPEDWNRDYQELTDEEVKAAGIACNGEIHFPVAGQELIDPIIKILEGQSYEAAGTNSYSYNEKYDDGATWYATWTTVDLMNEEGEYRYVEIEYDTADEQLHQISLELGTDPRAAVVAAEVLVLLEDKGALKGASGCGEAVLQPLLEAIKNEEEYSLSYGNLWLDGISWESEYQITIRATEE